TVVDVLVSSAKRADEPGEILELVKFAGQCFDVCRNNRNSLAHSMTVEGRDDSTFWIRASRKSDYQQSQMKLKLEDLLRVSKEIASTATFILKLQMHRNYAIRGGPGELTLPDRFPMPLKLKSREVNIAVEAKKFGWDLKHK
ncbi:MAG TPA: hypothetical protein VK146_08100, partial [Tabrizicola sp.]|nr:hypothetical protein [Tabrizicola sp.]